jgi:2-polyprenyl-6-methoxyphenol hydroxylase-like FAD-dependent oxidoreductase
MKFPRIQHAKHAVVIGGSLAGLLTARVLSDYFDQVTILERDPVIDLPQARKGQPQTVHIHGLLTKGFQLLEQYFPGIGEALVEGGALTGDFAEGIRWHQFGGYKVQSTSGLIGMMMGRPFLEWQIRQRVVALRNVTLRSSCAASELITSADQKRVIGVRVIDRAGGNQPEVLSAGLVVDASGRGSSALKWLDQLGYSIPDEEEVKIKVGYATRLYRRDPQDQYGVMISADPPTGTRGAYLFAIEGDRWIVTAGGYLGDHPPTEETGFLDFLRSLPAPDIYNILSRAEPLSEIFPYKYPASLRRHYEKLNRFPEGYLVLGDAFASFNPIYGQGMTSAALQAKALDEILKKRGSLHSLWRPFFRRAAKVVDTPWQLAVGEDFRYPEAEGKKSLLTDFLNGYVLKVHKATHYDKEVYAQFLRVMNLMEPPASLLSPKMIWKVLKQHSQARTTVKMATEP